MPVAPIYDWEAAGGAQPRPDFTTVEAIDHFANYFKHSDEWPIAWTPDNVPPNAKRTSVAVKELGAVAQSDYVMIGALNVVASGAGSDSDQVVEMQRVVEGWATKLLADIEAVIGK